DGAGGVHIAFTRRGLGLYVRERLPSGAWTPATRVFDGSAWSPDLALDSAGHEHLVFGIANQLGAAGVRYATNRTGSWVVSAVAAAGGHEPSLAIDAAGHAHVAYLESLGSALGIHYATNAGGAFVSSAVRASVDGAGSGFASATDALGHHHVAYASHRGDPNPGLYYGTDASGGWVLGRITSAWPSSVGLALDSSGRAHIAFTQLVDPATGQPLPLAARRVGYASNQTGAWVIERASPGPDVGDAGVAVAIDATDHPVIVHPNASLSKLLRIRRVSGAWATDTIYGAVSVRQPSILIDPSGVLHAAISARVGADPGLRIVYLRGTTGSWLASSATGGATSRVEPAIGRAADGTVWIAESETDHGIRVHRRNPTTGAWVQTSLASSAADAFPTLAIDTAGRVHVAWSNGSFYGSSGCAVPECAAGPGVRHAVLVGTAWQTTKLTPRWQDAQQALSVGRDGSLTLVFERVGHGLRLLELIQGKPAATIRLRPSSDTGVSSTDRLTSAAAVTWDLTFNRPVTGLTAADISHTGTATGCVAAVPTGSGTAWAVTLTGCSAGTVGLVLKAGSVSDARGVAGPIAAITAAAAVIDRTAPIATVPAAALRAGAQLSGTALPLHLGWSVSDAGGSGIDRHEAGQSTDGGTTWTSLSTSLTSPALNVLSAPGATVRFRVRSIDRAGNAGAWITGPLLSPLLVQQTSTAIRYAGAWSTSSSASYSAGTTRYALVAGRSASYSFSGRSVAWVASRSITRGRVRVYVDGALAATVDLSGPTSHRVLVWQRTWSTTAVHTIKLVVVGTSGRPRADVDAFAVLR
ncbi:MAG: hypothetical protein QOF49_2114, partial [Chloroflexota bacterium]|nr:hypothetical protein [Chloroflexota bacterium]